MQSENGNEGTDSLESFWKCSTLPYVVISIHILTQAACGMPWCSVTVPMTRCLNFLYISWFLSHTHCLHPQPSSSHMSIVKSLSIWSPMTQATSQLSWFSQTPHLPQISHGEPPHHPLSLTSYPSHPTSVQISPMVLTLACQIHLCPYGPPSSIHCLLVSLRTPYTTSNQALDVVNFHASDLPHAITMTPSVVHCTSHWLTIWNIVLCSFILPAPSLSHPPWQCHSKSSDCCTSWLCPSLWAVAAALCWSLPLPFHTTVLYSWPLHCLNSFCRV